VLYILRFHFSHLYPTGFTPSSVWTTGLKTLCFASEFNYVKIASFHFDQSFLRRYSSTDLGLRSLFSLTISSNILYEKILSIIISF